MATTRCIRWEVESVVVEALSLCAEWSQVHKTKRNKSQRRQSNLIYPLPVFSCLFVPITTEKYINEANNNATRVACTQW